MENLTEMPLLPPTSGLSVSTVPSFYYRCWINRLFSKSSINTPVSLLPPRSSVHANRLCSELSLLPSTLGLFSTLGKTSPGFHCHILSHLPPLDPDNFLFLWQGSLRGVTALFSLPLFPFLVGYPFFCIFCLLSFFVYSCTAWPNA